MAPKKALYMECPYLSPMHVQSFTLQRPGQLVPHKGQKVNKFLMLDVNCVQIQMSYLNLLSSSIPSSLSFPMEWMNGRNPAEKSTQGSKGYGVSLSFSNCSSLSQHCSDDKVQVVFVSACNSSQHLKSSWGQSEEPQSCCPLSLAHVVDPIFDHDAVKN